MYNTPITENDWRGLTLQEAKLKAESIGYTWRIVEENGKALMLDYNNRSNRLNFRVRDGIIIGCYPG
jgi:hypothetical protein